MEQLKGIILDIYIPKEYNNKNELIDIMDRNKITFKIKTDYSIENIELEQDDENVNLQVGNTVLITKQKIDGVDFIDIDKWSENE